MLRAALMVNYKINILIVIFIEIQSLTKIEILIKKYHSIFYSLSVSIAISSIYKMIKAQDQSTFAMKPETVQVYRILTTDYTGESEYFCHTFSLGGAVRETEISYRVC